MKTKIIIIATIAILILTGCPKDFPRTNDPADRDFGEPFYYHYYHMVELKEDWGIMCTDCHEGATQSTTSEDMPLVTNEQCSYCHEGNYMQEAGVEPTPLKSGYSFNHQLHLELVEEDCTQCHSSVLREEYARYEVIPDMQEVCFTCHDDNQAPQHCDLCHQDPIIAPPSHTLDWNNRHKVDYIADKERCDLCHADQHDCIVCHRGDIVVAWHDPDYILLHQADVYDDGELCYSCHERNECYDCHRNHSVAVPFVNPHPPGFRFNHSLEAKTNLNSCISCHDQSTCILCHRP